MQVGGDQLIGSCTFPVMKVDKVMPKRPEWVTLWKKMESGSSAQGTISSAPEVRGEILISFQLIPIEGPATGGSRISLSAMRLIGAPLTDLPTLEVYSGG